MKRFKNHCKRMKIYWKTQTIQNKNFNNMNQKYKNQLNKNQINNRFKNSKRINHKQKIKNNKRIPWTSKNYNI